MLYQHQPDNYLSSVVRLLTDVCYTLWEFVAFATLGRLERQLLLYVAEVNLEGKLKRFGSGSAVEQALIKFTYQKLKLVAGRTLNAAEKNLAVDLLNNGATELELWIMFSGRRLRTREGLIHATPRLIDWVAIATVTVPMAYISFILGLILKIAIFNSDQINYVCLSLVLAISLSVAKVLDLFSFKPFYLISKWSAVLEAHNVIH